MISQEDALNLFDYIDGSLYWKKPVANYIKSGKRAGHIHNDYIRITFQGVRFFEHQVVFLMFNGYLPKMIDHVNGVTTDNRVENLRVATPSLNGANRKTNYNNKSGYKGVYFNKGVGKWISSIRKDGKLTHLGCFNSPEDAHKAYCDAADKLYGEYANYGK